MKDPASTHGGSTYGTYGVARCGARLGTILYPAIVSAAETPRGLSHSVRTSRPQKPAAFSAKPGRFTKARRTSSSSPLRTRNRDITVITTGLRPIPYILDRRRLRDSTIGWNLAVSKLVGAQNGNQTWNQRCDAGVTQNLPSRTKLTTLTLRGG